uniref:GDSL esterase/lipase EXL3 n=2 Tax=Cajanus cajan TaxID=3821 RepID=A0A151QTT1_CAJCA|nr:GDSL esterase/lipase EXL3 [Cajanus cajan]
MRVPKTSAVKNGRVPALFSFGDSILDTGNNNLLLTLSKCNYPPYGMDFYGGIPTGRFCDGRNPSDLIAEALGIKATLPAYLSGTLRTQDLPTGVCFASGGSGIDDVTSAIQGVLSLSAQLRLFEDYIGRLRALVGQQRASYIISNALILISAGNNDIAITYYDTLVHLQPFPMYADRLVLGASNFVKSLYALGVRRVWVLSTLPLGCLPGGRTIAGGPLRICAPIVNLQAQLFNGKLASAVYSTRASFPNYDIRFIDVYTPLYNLVQNPLSAGFSDSSEGCCGTAIFGVSGLCNLLSVCPFPSTYIFWDFAHPTERAYRFIVSSILRRQGINNVSTSFSFSHVNSSLVH